MRTGSEIRLIPGADENAEFMRAMKDICPEGELI
jgi:hypothetical protein